MTDLGMNVRAYGLANQCIAGSHELRMAVQSIALGALVAGAGDNAAGGLASGLALAELCIGGLGHVDFTSLTIGGDSWPGVNVWTDHPAESCMASQYAGWAINPEGFFAMGSGPLRAKARVEKELFSKLGYAENGARGVLVLEGRALPTDDVIAWIASRAGVAPEALTVLIAPTASTAGGV